jgi:hypothetical protein
MPARWTWFVDAWQVSSLLLVLLFVLALPWRQRRPPEEPTPATDQTGRTVPTR